MITFNRFTDDRKGLIFNSYFNSDKKIKIKIIDTYTGLIAWGNEMIVREGEYFFSYPRIVDFYGFEICDSDTNEIYLKLDIYDDSGYISIKKLDILNKLHNFKYIDKHKDMLSAYPLYDIFINKCYTNNISIENGDVVIDIGANIGFFSYYAIINGASKVYAFEPGLAQSQSIKDNFGDIDTLTIESKAVSNHTDTLTYIQNNTFSVKSTNYINMSNMEDYIITECECVNLMEYCVNNNINKINFLKIDCEGAEYDIFKSLSDDFIKNIDKISMEFHLNKDGKVKSLIKRLKDLNFDVICNDVEIEVGLLDAKNKNI